MGMRRNILVKPDLESKIYHKITPENTGWKHLHFSAKKMDMGEVWKHNTDNNEYIIVLLSGNYSVVTPKGTFKTKNGRKDVFSGIAHTLYLPRNTEFELVAESDELDIAFGWCATDRDNEIVFKRPEEVDIEIRGGDNATRQINELVPPGFGNHKLVCVEVYTPSGNWSSFPAHKHDERKVADDGTLLEACLDETYFYKIDKPAGFALQRVYNDNRTLDEVAVAMNNDVVLVPEGYHPVAACNGYNVYYLNFLAGSDQSLANTDDPDHQWVYNSWKSKDVRLPIVTAEMNKK